MPSPARIKFVVLGAPVPQPRPRVVTINGRGMAISNPRSHPVTAWKDQVRLTAQDAWQGRPPLQGPVGLAVAFLLPRPARLTLKSKPNPRCWAPVRPDGDNLVKVIKDVLNGLCWKDDGQVVELLVHKLYASAGEQPRAEVTVYAM